MRLSLKYSALLASALALGACADHGADPVAPVAADQPAVSTATADRLARAIAGALARPEVRDVVRDAMRASPYGEHKVAFGEFARTEAGRLLVGAAADAAGTDAATVDGWIAALPELDFYAPFRDHRLGWRGTADVVVAATLDAAAPQLTGFGADGRAVALRRADGVPARPMLLLQPAERKSRRVSPQLAIEGTVIQSADDGELSGRMTVTDALGVSRTVELADLAAGSVGISRVIYPVCDESGYCQPVEPVDPVDPGPVTPTVSPATRLNRFKIFFDTEWGDEDVRFTSRFIQYGSVVANSVIEVDADCCSYYNINRTLFPYHRITDSYNQGIDIAVVEMDPAWSDHKGSANTGYDGNNTFFTWADGQKGVNLQPYLTHSCQAPDGNWTQTCRQSTASVDLKWAP